MQDDGLSVVGVVYALHCGKADVLFRQAEAGALRHRGEYHKEAITFPLYRTRDAFFTTDTAHGAVRAVINEIPVTFRDALDLRRRKGAGYLLLRQAEYGDTAADQLPAERSDILELQKSAFFGIGKDTIRRRSCRTRRHQQFAVGIDQRSEHVGVGLPYPVAAIDRPAADRSKQRVLGAVGVLCPEHIPVADVQLVVIQRVVGVLEQMLLEAVLDIGEEIVAVPRYRRRGTGQDVFHRHAHAVDHRAVKAGSAVFKRAMQADSRFAQREGVLKAEGDRALTVHLDKADALIAERLIPVAVEARAALGVGREPSVCRAAKVLRFLCRDRRAGRDTAPVAHQSMPYAEPFDPRALMQVFCHFPKALGEFFPIGLKLIQQAIFQRQPAVVNDHPLDRDLLFGKLRRLVPDTALVDVGVKGVPAAPAEPPEHLGQSALFSFADISELCRLREYRRDRFIDRLRFGIQVQRLVQLAQPAVQSRHDQLKLTLCTACQIRLAPLAHHRQKAGVSVGKAEQRDLRLVGDIRNTFHKRGTRPP